MESTERVVIAGGGMAAARLALRLGGCSGRSVTVLGEEPHAAYNRVLLAEVLAGRYPADVIALPALPAGTVRRGGTRVTGIERRARQVVCEDGTAVAYDRLVLATGSNPVLPPLRGLLGPDGGELPEGVHAFRTLDDCLALSAAVRSGTPAVVIGGGLLGVSAARALARRGARVVLAQQGGHLMERQLDGDAAQLLRGHLTGLGVEVHTECRVRGIETAGQGAERRVQAVELADGFRLDAELVVLACGVRPRDGLAREAGLATGARGGVLVDDRLTTSDPAIHAIGDCAAHRGVLYGLAGAAQEQADALADLLTAGPGTSAAYTGTRALTRLTLAGAPQDRAATEGPLDIAAFGITEPAPGDDVVRLADATRGIYRKLVVTGDRLQGGILLGDLDGVGALARTWEGDEPLPDAPLLHLLTHDGGSA
jgi:assimilatory nitrate reductase electron transfer subunit